MDDESAIECLVDNGEDDPEEDAASIADAIDIAFPRRSRKKNLWEPKAFPFLLGRLFEHGKWDCARSAMARYERDGYTAAQPFLGFCFWLELFEHSHDQRDLNEALRVMAGFDWTPLTLFAALAKLARQNPFTVTWPTEQLLNSCRRQLSLTERRLRLALEISARKPTKELVSYVFRAYDQLTDKRDRIYVLRVMAITLEQAEPSLVRRYLQRFPKEVREGIAINARLSELIRQSRARAVSTTG